MEPLTNRNFNDLELWLNGPKADRLLSIEEAAEILNESVDSLYRSWRKLPFAFKMEGRKHIKFSMRGPQEFIQNQIKEKQNGKTMGTN